jgi:hypothetical protein
MNQQGLYHVWGVVWDKKQIAPSGKFHYIKVLQDGNTAKGGFSADNIF